MRHSSLAGLASLLVLFGLVAMAQAGNCCGPCQNCRAADGCSYRDVVRHRCVLVPEKKPIKKTVYECHEVPYCAHRLPKFGHCDCCTECLASPKYKRVLVKREIVVGEICTMKCVVEEVVERVPGPCCRCGLLPCGEGNEDASTAAAEPPKLSHTRSVSPSDTTAVSSETGGSDRRSTTPRSSSSASGSH